MDLDYLSVSMGNFNSIEIHTPDRHHEPGQFIDFAGSIRAAVAGRVPVVGCGRILTPSQAEDVLAKDYADMVGLCRPLLADERWVEKAREDLESRIRVCISCNQCWGSIIDERRILCNQNAVTGTEIEYGGDIPQAADHKRVVVVGGGPSGMEAARVAAARGHDVILFERADHLGGSVAIAATIPGHGDIDNVRGYLADEVRANGVEVRLKQDVKSQWVLDEMPDAVVIATGSVPRNDQLGAPVDFPVLTSMEVVRDRVATGKRAVLFDEDGYYQGAEVAEMVARNGTELIVVTRVWEFAREIPAVSKVTTMRALDELGVEIVPVTWFSRIEGRSVVLAHYLTGRERVIEDVDTIIHIGRADALDGLYRELKGKVPELYLVGDAYQPRRIHDAVMEGHRVGRAI
jgi:thioredoxin reductase